VNWLDILLLVSALSFAWSGYRQGFVVGVLAFTGFIGGGIGGLVVAPSLVAGLDQGLGQSVLAIAIVLLGGSGGYVVERVALGCGQFERPHASTVIWFRPRPTWGLSTSSVSVR
jgi:hypothetical protein